MHGLLVLDKPPGVSSHAALGPVKRAVGRGVKVGHAGTLDPFATGVLLVLLGRATRLFCIAMGMQKTYRAGICFGVGTDTLDPEGEIVARADPGSSAPPDLEEALAAFCGRIEQVPPAHSALKVNGERAYRLARQGRAAELAPRPVTVHSLRLLDLDWPDLLIEVTCGAGTYLRALARDLGARLGLPAHLTELRRTAVGPFTDADAFSGEPDPGDLVPPLDIARAAGLYEVPLDAAAAARFAHGEAVEADAPVADRLAVVNERATLLLGLGRAERTGLLLPVRVFAGGGHPA